MFVTELRCPRCDQRFPAHVLANRCDCGSPLLVDYDLERVAAATSVEAIAGRGPDMWRYRELLPARDPRQVVSMGEGFTPLTPIPGQAWGCDDLWLKDDGLNPTGSFKARGASCGISMALALGVREVALPTAGNAGGAWAAYGAAAGLVVHVAMPRDAPAINRIEVEISGADLTLVDGLISDAGALIAQGVEEHGWFDAATLKEPYRIEGKKTLGLEIAEQLATHLGASGQRRRSEVAWELPDAIVYPAGGGVGLIGIWRALEQLQAMGWIAGELPRLIAVQAAGCAPLAAAFDDGLDEAPFWDGATTIASGLRVPKALGDFLVLRAIRATDGVALAVSDDEIATTMREVAASSGRFLAPEGAATFAALPHLRERGTIAAGDRVVVINTGTGLKYPEAAEQALAG